MDPNDKLVRAGPMQETLLRAEIKALLVLTGAYAAIMTAVFSALWSWQALWSAVQSNGAWVILIMFLSFYPHEWLHALGFRWFGNVPLSSITIHGDWRRLDFRAISLEPISIRTFRASALMPCVAFVAAPGIAGLTLGTGELVVLSVAMSATVVTDLMDVWLVRHRNSNETFRMSALAGTVTAAPDRSTDENR